jgi:DNA-binding NarL/FixJ family response regulator
MMKPCTKDEPCHLLIVEDDIAIRQMLAHSIEHFNKGEIIAHYSATLDDALIQVGVLRFDMILLDLELPFRKGLSKGLGTLELMLRAVDHATPIVVFTGPLNPDEKDHAIQMGAMHYILKGTCSPPVLLDILRDAANRQRTRDAILADRNRWREVALQTATELEALKQELARKPDRLDESAQQHLDASITRLSRLAQTVGG